MDIDISRLGEELALALATVRSGELWQEARFGNTPPEFRRLNDIALSGDGEPTCRANFDRAVQAVADALDHADLAGRVKIVVITNSTLLQSPQMQRALPILDEHHSEIWAKLDAGTEDFFQRVNCPAKGTTLDGVCENLLAVARDRAIVIQTLLFRTNGQDPPPAEVEAYCSRLRKLRDHGGKIRQVQLHTVARPPAETFVTPLPNDTLDALGETIRAAIAPVPVEVFYGRN